MVFNNMQFTFYKRSTIALLLFALINIAIGQFTDIDLQIEDYYFDAATHQFLWKNNWFANDFMHGYVKQVIMWSGKLLIIVVLLDIVFRWKVLQGLTRIRLRFIALASVIIPFITGTIKATSALHCPWDEVRYGGLAPFLRLFDTVPAGMQPGHCFPAGHATVGLWLAALCVFWLPNKPKTAFAVFLAGLSVGFALGWVQQMRGAHFLFHTLWSTWIACFVILAMLCFTKSLNKQIYKAI
jgi:membrane-associated PAP2 superfamily phosphatase